MTNQTESGKVVCEYLKKYGNTIGKHAMARLLIKDRPDLFKSKESARSLIKYYTGSFGDDALKKLQDKRFLGLCNPNAPSDTRPYILILDIETAPMIGYIWGTYKQNVSPSQLIEGPCMISWAAKWLFDSTVKSDILTHDEAINRDDSRITLSAWQWINKADIIIAHNGDKFDLPFLNSRFVVHGCKPPQPYQTIDTLKVAKANRWGFRFSSNKLDSICLDLGIPRKLHTDFSLWSRSLNGEQDALDDMIKYNRNDVQILEEVYVKLRPFIKSHPNVGLYAESVGSSCGNCGSVNIEFDEGQFYFTTVGKYSSGRCTDCGAIVRTRVSALSTNERKNLLSTTAR